MSETPQGATNVATMPSRAQFKKLSEVRTIGEALRHPDITERFKSAVPRHLSPERMLRVCALAVQKTPKLAEADMMSLLGAMLGLAALGLEPNTPLGLAYLIPFEKRSKVNGKWQTVGVEIQVIIGYRGYIDLARRAGSLVSLHADVVYDGDEFSFEYGSRAHLRHVPQGVRDGRRPLWVYAHARLTDGEAFEVLPYGQVLRVRDGSQGYIAALRGKENNPRGFDSAPWVAHEHEMASKTMVRRIAKMLPMSIDLMNAAALDAASETGNVNLRALATAPSTELMDMALLTADAEVPMMDPGGFDVRERETVEAPRELPKQQPAQENRPEHKPEPTHASPQQRQPAPERTFEAWAADEIGEPVEAHGSSLVFRRPVEFAAWYVTRWQASSNREALRDNNADALEEVRKDRAAADYLAQIEGDIAGPDPEPTHQGALTIPVNAKGQPYLPGYVASVREALAALTAPEQLAGWVALNGSTYSPLPRATKTAIETAINDRRAQLGLSTETGERVGGQQDLLGKRDADDAWAQALTDRINAATTREALRAIGQDAVVVDRVRDLTRRRPGLVQLIEEADHAKDNALAPESSAFVGPEDAGSVMDRADA